MHLGDINSKERGESGVDLRLPISINGGSVYGERELNSELGTLAGEERRPRRGRRRGGQRRGCDHHRASRAGPCDSGRLHRTVYVTAR